MNTKKDNINRRKIVLDYFAFVIALVSIAISITSYCHSKKIYQSSQEERLLPILKSNSANDFATLIPFVRSEQNLINEKSTDILPILQVFWECMLSNIGDRPLSITEYEMREESRNGQIFYTHLDGGLFDINVNKLGLPITLGPGESKKILIKIGLIIDSTANKLLRESYEPYQGFSMRDARIELAKSGIDIYGNKVEYESFENGKSFVIKGPSPERREQNIILIFQTGKGYRFAARASLYSFLDEYIKTVYNSNISR